MKKAQIASLAVLLLLSHWSWAEEASQKGWFSFGKKDPQPAASSAYHSSGSHRTSDRSPSLWQKFEQDMARLNNGTKRFFAKTADALTWKSAKSAPPPRPLHPWQVPSQPKQKKKSWFTPFWAQEKEAPLPQSPQDFVGMERPQM